MELNTTLAAQSYATARPVTAPRPTSEGEGPGQAFSAAATSFVQTLQQGEQAARASVVDGADSQTLVMALADDSGHYQGSNVDLVVEIADSREAQRSYEANLRMFDQARQMTSSLMDLLRR